MIYDITHHKHIMHGITVYGHNTKVKLIQGVTVCGELSPV